MTHAQKHKELFTFCYNHIKLLCTNKNYKALIEILKTWCTVDAFIENIDSIRRYNNDYWMYFEDDSCVQLNTLNIYNGEIPNQEVYKTSHPDEIIWPETILPNDTFCMDCTWEGPIWKPCSEHIKQ